MLVTFEEARKLVEAEGRPEWTSAGLRGTYYVAEYGFEDEHLFLVIEGAREHLVDGDFDYALVGGDTILVDKSTGIILRVSFLGEWHERIQAMTPVGEPQPRE